MPNVMFEYDLLIEEERNKWGELSQSTHISKKIYFLQKSTLYRFYTDNHFISFSILAYTFSWVFQWVINNVPSSL